MLRPLTLRATTADSKPQFVRMVRNRKMDRVVSDEVAKNSFGSMCHFPKRLGHISLGLYDGVLERLDASHHYRVLCIPSLKLLADRFVEGNDLGIAGVWRPSAQKFFQPRNGFCSVLARPVAGLR